MQCGFTSLPNIIIKNQTLLNLKPLDILVLLHLESFRWFAEEKPFPAKSLIASYLGVDARTVQRSIKKMQEAGYLTRVQRKTHTLTNEYDLSLLPKHPKVMGLVEEELKKRADSMAAKEKREQDEMRRITTPKAYALANSKRADEVLP
jgi:DNA-binding MarR family transcriptional regulator